MATQASKNKYNVAILEDKQTCCLASLLRGQYYDVSLFETGRALELAFKENMPDVLVIDFEFAIKNGVSLKEIKSFGFPVIRVSEKTDILDRLSSIRDGCSYFLSKPVEKRSLVSAIENLIASRDMVPYRVLMVDDDVVTMEYHSVLLEQKGVVVKRLSTPLQCLDVMDEFKPDLVLLDVEMPEINGVELSQVIRQVERYADIPIIFVSSESDIERQQAAMQYGGEYFISKPVDPEHFQVAITSRLKYARQTNKLHQELSRAHLISEQQRITIDQHAIVSITDVIGDIIYINDKFCEISGYTEDELIGKNHRLLKSAMHAQSFYEEIWHVISGGNIWHGVICNLNKAGEEYWVDSTIVPFLDEQGLPCQYVSVRTDITQIRINEERLMLSQKFAGIGSWDWNLSSNNVYWSETAAPLFGYANSSAGFTYESFIQAIHPEDRLAVEEAIRACIEDGQDYNIEHRVIWPDESVHWLHEIGNVIKNNRGQAKHMLGVVRDITLRKTIMEKLSYSEQLMRSQLDSMSEGMFGLDSDGRATFVNQAACAMLGYAQDQLLGQLISEIILLKDHDHVADDIFLHTRQEVMTETNFKCIDGKVIPVEYASMPVLQDKKKDGVVVTFKDISQRKLNEAELISAKEQAEKANKAKSRFLASMSHELRTPMNAIIGFGQLLEMDMSSTLDEMQKDNVAEILKAAKHLLELINEVLDLSKIEAGQTQVLIEPVLISEPINECIQLISPLAENSGIEINLNLDGKSVDEFDVGVVDVAVLADKRRLKQVFLNLLSNAVKYNSPQGKITVSINLGSDDNCVIDIKDTGKGMSEQHVQDLFQPFNRFGFEDSAVEGTGIGLVISKNLVEMMGGQISCHSEPGKGSTFSVELSTLDQEYIQDGSVTDGAASQQAIDKGRRNILYIEDNPANVRFLAQVFSREKDLQLSTALEPLMGLSIIADNKPDLVLLDINLPGMSGFDVLEEIRDLFGADYPVIAVSANTTKTDIEKGLKAGFNKYITKPVDINLLLESVRQLLKS
ncbi:MAG: response regulator [Gammaproteobacteria bacterium]|nr:response regulator [Gammaproteobacteria bacterium]